MISSNGNSCSSGGGGNGSELEERSSSQEEGTSQGAAAAAENVGCGSVEAVAAISCLELDAWIRDDDGTIDCMMMLPEVPLDGDSTSPEDSGMHAQDCCEQFEHKPHDDEMIFCRSSSSCSSTFPDSNQETLELNIPDDFFGDRQQQHDEERRQAEQQVLPPLTEARSGFAPDLRKIIVKKPVMDKAVERLGGGRRGAMRLWNIIQVWLKHQQQQGGGASIEGLALENFSGFMDMPIHPHQQQQQQQHFQHQGFPAATAGFGGGDAASNGGGQYFGDSNVVPAQHFSSAYSDATVVAAADPGTPRSMATTSITSSTSAASAAATTRAARKSRMARQRRHKSVYAASHSPVSTGAGVWSSTMASSTGGFLATTAATTITTTTTTSSSSLPLPTTHAAPGAREQHQHQFGSCRDGIKARMSCDKSVKFLLQKELKPSDVGNLGRIVLPKDNENKA